MIRAASPGRMSKPSPEWSVDGVEHEFEVDVVTNPPKRHAALQPCQGQLPSRSPEPGTELGHDVGVGPDIVGLGERLVSL
jgi:hypothetical protein